MISHLPNSVLTELSHILPYGKPRFVFDPSVPIHVSGREWRNSGIINKSILETSWNVYGKAGIS